MKFKRRIAAKYQAVLNQNEFTTWSPMAQSKTLEDIPIE